MGKEENYFGMFHCSTYADPLLNHPPFDLHCRQRSTAVRGAPQLIAETHRSPATHRLQVMLSCQARRINWEAEACLFEFLQCFARRLLVGRLSSGKLWASLNETDRRVKLFCSLFGEYGGVRVAAAPTQIRLANCVGELTSYPASTKGPCLICSTH